MEQIIEWIYDNLALVAIAISAVAALGAIYPLLKDFVPRLIRFTWDVIRTSFIFAWWILTPIRKPLGILLVWLINRLIEWFASRKSRKIKPGVDKSNLSNLESNT